MAHNSSKLWFSNPLFQQQLSVWQRNQSPGWLPGFGQIIVHITPQNASPAIYVSQDRVSLSVKVTMHWLQGQQREPQQQQHPSLELSCAELLPARPGRSLQDCQWEEQRQKEVVLSKEGTGSNLLGHFKALTFKSRHISGLSKSFSIRFCHE